jgi:hypothetical protein
MKQPGSLSRTLGRPIYGSIAIVCVAILAPGDVLLFAQQAEPQVMTTTTTEKAPAPKIPNDQLDSLVSPIALYPDPLLAQTLAASTYPLEMIQLQQWMERNKDLKDKALADAVAKQPWEPSVQSMVAFPDVVQRLSGNIQWTTDLGNAFLAQQSDVMEAVQRMRGKAEGTGSLKTSAQQTVETKSVEGGKQVIVIESANPEVVHVPSYDPTVVYGAPAYPYPSYYYPGYVAGAALTFGVGLALGAAWNGGYWGNCDWNGGNVNINNNNNFNRNTNINRGQGNRPSQLPSKGGKWQHNPQHRGNAPYGDRGTANKYGGRARGEQAGGANRPGAGNRPSGGRGNTAGNRPGSSAGANRPGGGAGANRPGGGAGANRPGGGASTRPASRPGGSAGSSARVGNRSVSSSPRGGSNSAFSGSRGGGYSGSSARASSSRGGSSMGGGGMSRGGGGRGGGGRR